MYQQHHHQQKQQQHHELHNIIWSECVTRIFSALLLLVIDWLCFGFKTSSTTKSCVYSLRREMHIAKTASSSHQRVISVDLYIGFVGGFEGFWAKLWDFLEVDLEITSKSFELLIKSAMKHSLVAALIVCCWECQLVRMIDLDWRTGLKRFGYESVVAGWLKLPSWIISLYQFQVFFI